MIDRSTAVMLSVWRLREREASTLRKIFPFAFGIGLLLYAGYVERYLRPDPSPFSLSLYLTSLICVACAIAFSFFLGTAGEILRKTSLFPVHRRSTFDFVILGALGNPLTLALLLSTALAVGIVYGGTAPAKFLCVLHTVAVLVVAFLFCACILVFPFGRARFATAVSSSIAGTVLLIAALAIIFTAPWASPAVLCATSGILAAARGEIVSSLGSLGYAAGALIVLYAVGRRFA